jgi:hypothetical protein
MRERFGDESVFMDVTDIRPGVDFALALDSALSSCRVVLVVIGSQWLTCTDASGRRRLDDPGDHVRMEIAQALRRDARVIPVLVRGAAMPRERDLPDDLRPLARRQAQEVSDSRWSYDTEQLVHSFENDLGAPGQEPGDARTSRSTTAAAGATAFAGRALTVGALRHGWVRLGVPAAVAVVAGLILSGIWSGGGDRTGPDAQAPRDGGAAAPAARDPDAASGAFKGAPPEDSPARLPASGEARAGDALFKVLGGLVSGGAGGPHTVRLFVRTTNVGARYGMNISPDSFRLIVGGRATPPDEAPIEVIAMQSATEGWVSFRLPADAAAVLLQVGDIRQATAKIPIDLGSAAKDASEKPAPTWRYPIDIAAAFEKRAGPIVFVVGGIRLEHFADAVAPLQPEKLLLSVKVRMKNVGAQYGYAVGGDEFRLLIDDVPLAPTKFPIQALNYQDDLDAEVVFLMPGTAATAILQLGNLAAETVRVPVDLSPARLQASR